MNTLEKLYLALRDLSPAVELPEDLRKRAEAPLLRMLAIGCTLAAVFLKRLGESSLYPVRDPRLPQSIALKN